MNRIKFLLFSLVLSIGALLPNVGSCDEDTSQPIQPNIQSDQLYVNGQVTLVMTPTMEQALMHGISLEYTLEISLRDPDQPFWKNPVSSKRTRIRLAYDSLKQTYLLTNLTLQRFSTDRDLKRALNTLGSLQSIPLALLSKLQSGHTYEIHLDAQLERDALPNALRLSSLFDPEWKIKPPNHYRYWTAP